MIELRFFGGLTVEETAAVLNISGQSVMRDWRLARSWLFREIRGLEKLMWAGQPRGRYVTPRAPVNSYTSRHSR